MPLLPDDAAKVLEWMRAEEVLPPDSALVSPVGAADTSMLCTAAQLLSLAVNSGRLDMQTVEGFMTFGRRWGARATHAGGSFLLTMI